MSAVILPFKGEWHGHTDPDPVEANPDNRAAGDARLIRQAKRENDDWTARLLLAILETLTSKQREHVEFRLMGPTLDSQSALQALAIVQLATGDKAHRERVRNILNAFALGRAE